MALRGRGSVQRIRPRPQASVESEASMIGPINLDTKLTGKRSAGNPHAAFDVAGAGNGAESYRASPRPYVCPGKVGMFSGSQSHQGKNQKPCSSDGRREGNRPSEAHRQIHPRGGGESSGRNESERRSGLVSARFRRSSRQPNGEGSTGPRQAGRRGDPLRRGGSGSTMTRTCRATGEALLAPSRNRWSKVGRITGDPGKSTEGERVAEGPVVARKPRNCGGAKEPCCVARLSSKREAGAR